MKQNIFVILLLLCLKINAQVQDIPVDILKYDPNSIPQKNGRYFLNSNLENDFRGNNHFFNLDDFELRKGKAVKSVSFYFSDDTSQAYYYEFDKEGKITFIDDFVNECTHSYNYSKNLITVIEYSRHYQKNMKIDSIYFDDKRNITKQLYTSYMDFNSNEICVQSFLVNKYSEDNKLVKKYFYGDHRKDKQVSGYVCLYENFKDSIIERKYYSLDNKKLQELFNNSNYIDSKYDKTIYFLNEKNNICKINYISNDDNQTLRNYKTINYDKLGRITEFIESEGNSNEYFKYDDHGNVSEWKIGDDITIYNYDNNIYISTSEQVYGTMQKIIDLSFINDQYGNWIKKLDKVNIDRPILARRKITYY